MGGPLTLRRRAQATLAFVAIAAVLSAAHSIWTLRETRMYQEQLAALRSAQAVHEGLAVNAENYLEHAPRDYAAYDRDLEVFHHGLQRDLATLDQLLSPLAFDALPSVEALARAWSERRAAFANALGDDPDAPRLEWAAQAIHDQAPELAAAFVRAASDQTIALQDARVRAEGVSAAGSSLIALLALVAALWTERRVLRPLQRTASAIRAAAGGRFGVEIEEEPVTAELNDLTRAFNGLSRRSAGLLEVVRALQHRRDPVGSLRALAEALRFELDVRWIAYHRGGTRTQVPVLDALSGVPLSAADEGALALAAQVAGPGATRALDLQLDDRAARTVLLTPLGGDTAGGHLLVGLSTEPRAHSDALELLDLIAPLLAAALQDAEVSEKVFAAVTAGMIRLAEHRDNETGLHLERMTRYSVVIAETLRVQALATHPVDRALLRDIERYAAMHDIGKVGVPDSILLKPGPLDTQELELMRRHPLIGGEVLRGCAALLPADSARRLEVAIGIAEAHHERFDGSGYPRGLAGDAIPLAARIVALADVFDALSTRRPYKDPWPFQRAFQHVLEQAGAHFDPVVVEAFALARAEVWEIHQRWQEPQPAASSPAAVAESSSTPSPTAIRLTKLK